MLAGHVRALTEPFGRWCCLWTPILLNLVTTAAVYGLLVLVFRYGVGADLLGLYRMPQIDAWVPIFLFVLLFGLSTDYEVFVVEPGP